MRAMVFTRPGVVEMMDVDPPEPNDGESTITVVAAGICGSELHGVSHPGFRQPPLVMGHEVVGTTPDGRRVAVNPFQGCGSCQLCSTNRQQLCRQRRMIGLHRPGGFAEQVAVPDEQIYDLPAGLEWDQAALIEPLANAVHAWRVATLDGPLDRVGIIGAGPIGLVTMLIARHEGAAVAVAELSQDRRDAARRLGAETVDDGLIGEFEVIFDAVGVPFTHRASVEQLTPGGIAIWLGLASSQPEFDALDLIRFGKTVRGSYAYSRSDFAKAVELAGSVDVSWASPFPLEDGPAIFHDLMSGRTDVLKAVLRP